jgi:hypothetical protein
MKPATQSLRLLQLHGPAMPGGQPGETFWAITLSAPHFGRGASLLQEDRTHPIRTLTLDVVATPKDGEPWRKARLLSQHVIGGFPNGHYKDQEDLTFHVRVGGAAEATSRDGSVFYTGHLTGVPTKKETEFQHVVATPLLGKSDEWPDARPAEIRMPACRLVQGTIPLFALLSDDPKKRIPWLRKSNPLGLEVFDFAGDKRVRLGLAPDGIVLDAKAPFPLPDGTAAVIAGRFLLAPVESDALELRLLPAQLTEAQRTAWSEAWRKLAPNGDPAAENLPGFKVELRPGGLPPAFAWRVKVEAGVITGFEEGIRVPGEDLVVRLLGPATAETRDGEAQIQPTAWVLSRPGSAGALEPATLAAASRTVWGKAGAEADWGDLSSTVQKWPGRPILSALLLPPAPAKPKEESAPRTALRIDVASSAKLEAHLLGRAGADAEHRLAHDEIQLATALRAAHGLPERRPGERDPERPLLAGFVPLSDGWLQLPIPNFPLPNPEKDSDFIAPPVPAPPNVLAGFLRYGEVEKMPDVLSAFPPAGGGAPPKLELTRAPWLVTVEGTQALAVAIALGGASGPTKAAAVLLGPELSTRGLLWLSADRPDDLEALPRLGAGAGAYLDVPLESFDTEKEQAIPVTVRRLQFVVERQTGGAPDVVTRQDLGLDLRFNPSSKEWVRRVREEHLDKSWKKALDESWQVLTGEEQRPDLGLDAEAALPLVLWLRHPAMPMAALMPMTRSASSAVRPLESRDLIPLVVDAPAQADGGPPLALTWTLAGGSVFPKVGAGDAPKVKRAAAWPWPVDDVAGIALAAFGVPGAELRVPSTAKAQPLPELWAALDFALRFDLPTLDEAFATASLPPAAEVKTPDPTDLPPPAVPLATALDWRAMGELWTHQSRRHALARVRYSYLDTFAAADGSTSARQVRDLVGGALWPVALGFKTGDAKDELPYGAVTIGTAPARAGNDALLGVSGKVEVAWEKNLSSAKAEVQLVGYAVPTIPDGTVALGKPPEFLVDARGLALGVIEDSAVLRREVFARFRDAKDAAASSRFDLVTSREAREIRAVADGPALLRFWFKDVPSATAATDSFQAAEGLDPDAWGDGHLPRAGFEWRLWPAVEKTMESTFVRGRDRLPFFGFGLEPLRLRQCSIAADGTPGPVTIRCRLHLGPRQEGPEAGANLVDLSLTWNDAKSAYLISGLDPVEKTKDPVIFALCCQETKDLSRRVQIATVPAWTSGKPKFSKTAVTVAMLGEDVRLDKNAQLDPAASPTGLVTLAWSPPPTPETLPPGEGQLGLESITVQTGTETIEAIVPPIIRITRWLRLLPAAEKAGGDPAPPALSVRWESGKALEFSAFGLPLKLAGQAELREERGAVTFIGTGAELVEPFPGYGGKGAFSVGLVARVSAFDPAKGIGRLSAGYVSGRWVAEAKGRAPDCILFESSCRRRVGEAELAAFWSGALTLHLRFTVASAIRWPRLTSLVKPIPFPGHAAHGRETLAFEPIEKSGFSHSVDYVLDGHRLAFATASRLAQVADGGTLFFAPAMATHTLRPEQQGGQPFTWTAVETIAVGRAKALIPEPVRPEDGGGEPPNAGVDKRTFKTDPLAFGARYRHILKGGSDNAAIPAPGMVAPGQGRLSTVLSGSLGHAFRAAFWEPIKDDHGVSHARPNSLAIAGGFVGFLGEAEDLSAPDSTALLVRLPVVALLGGGALGIGQSEATAEVAWADGTAALPVAVAWRAAATPASASFSALRAALLGGMGLAFAEAEVEAAILVEQSFRVPMDRPAKGALASTIFFPAAAVAVARLMSPPGAQLKEPMALSLLTGRAARDVSGTRETGAFASSLLTRMPPPEPAELGPKVAAKAALGPEKARSLLATLGDQVVIDEWEGPAADETATATPLVASRAFAEHTEPRAALLVEILKDGRARYVRASLPAASGRACFRRPVAAIAFADAGRGFGLAPGKAMDSWLRGVEEGQMAPFRDAADPAVEPVIQSGLAGLSRRLSLPAQAAPVKTTPPVWTAEARAPVYASLVDLKDAVSPPLSWLAPGQPRPRLPAQPALDAALHELFGPTLPEVQWVLPAAATSASVGDRAGIALARTLRLETAFNAFTAFDRFFARFGRPAQGGAWSVRTERTPRPGPLPENGDDPTRNRRPCASRLEPRLPVDVLRGPTDTISGEPNREGKFGAWVVKLVAAPEWDGMISDRFDGTVPVDVEIDVMPGSEVKEGASAAAMLLRLLMPAAGGGGLLNVASLVVGEKVIACQRVHFVAKVGHDFEKHPAVAGVLRGTLRIVLDPRHDQNQPVGGALLKDLTETLRAGFAAPPVELRLTVLPDSERDTVGTPSSPQTLTQPDPANPEIPQGDSRPPVTLRLPLMPVVRSRGALPLPPNSLLFIDSTYDADLGSAPAMHRQRIASVRPQPSPLSTDRGDLFATLYADRQRINRRASIAFMMDFAFERPLATAAQATADDAGADGDFVRSTSAGTFELALAVTTRDGVRRELLFGTPGNAPSTTALPKIAPATVYELPLGLVLETDRSPARLAAGDMLELTVSEPTITVPDGNQTKVQLDVNRRVKPALWDTAALKPVALAGLSDAGGGNDKLDQPLSRTVRILLTDEPVVEPPPALYAALVYRTAKAGKDPHQLSLPLYAQSPLPWRVTLRDAKADFRRGFVRRAAVFIWNLARPAAELPDTAVHIVKADRNGQTYLPPKTRIDECFLKTRRISP